MHQKFRLSIATAVILLLTTPFAMAAPLITINPADYTYHDPRAAANTALSIPYTITNNTPATLTNVTASRLPSGASSSTCSSIASGQSCRLTITIPKSATRKPGVIRSQFQVCAVNPNIGCTLVDINKMINITVSTDQSFLAITDIHLKDGRVPPITYGQDTGDGLWTSTRAELTTLINTQSPKFIVLLGDLPAHHDDANLNRNIGAVLTGLSGLNAISSNNMPVFYVYGNNDSLDVDYGPFFNGSVNLFSLDPTHNWPALNANPDCSVSPTTACTYTTTAPMPPEHADDMAYAQTLGYYSAYPLGSAVPLRFISFNSVILSFEYYVGGATQLAAAQAEMDWLSAQLAAASANGEAVYIAMHIPVGTDAFNHGDDMWNDTLILNNGLKFRDAFLALMEQYKNNVRTVMSAHTHLDELRALYPNQTANSMNVLDVGIPGITPQHYNNPGMQIFLYDNLYNLMEAKTYYTTPNPGIWTSYSFQNDYACPTGSSMFLCTSTNILPALPTWKMQSQPIPGNPYETDFSVRVPGYNPTALTSWVTILNTISVVPIA